MTSIPGVGNATATEVILATDEFKAINAPKKLAASAVRLPRRSSSFWRGRPSGIVLVSEGKLG